MYRDSFTRPTWRRVLLRWFEASFGMGIFFGVEVRVFVVLVPLIVMAEFARASYATTEVLLAGALYPALLYTIIYTH